MKTSAGIFQNWAQLEIKYWTVPQKHIVLLKLQN